MKNQVCHSTSAWFTVGEAKFVFMFVAALGLYQVYWFYRQWAWIGVAVVLGGVIAWGKDRVIPMS